MSQLAEKAVTGIWKITCSENTIKRVDGWHCVISIKDNKGYSFEYKAPEKYCRRIFKNSATQFILAQHVLYTGALAIIEYVTEDEYKKGISYESI